MAVTTWQRAWGDSNSDAGTARSLRLLYPAAGLDGDPVKYLKQYFQSFVYVDYDVGRDPVWSYLSNFEGYDLLLRRDVDLEELVPQGRQSPALLRQDYSDGRVPTIQPTFAIWAVYKRKPNTCPEHGPEYFSLLYIGGDGAVTYRSLFYSHKVSPAVVAVINPGTGFGNNWTDFTSSNRIFARLVRNTPTGMPDHLLYGGGNGEFLRHAPWAEYQTAGLILHEQLRLFARRTDKPEPDAPLDEFDDEVDGPDDYLDAEFNNL